MTGFTPEQVPVLNGIAREFGVFDHWFCEVPSQTFMNRSFWTAATSSGFVVNSPVRKWFQGNDAETIFERLEAHGKTWKVYVMEPMPLSFTGIIHYSRLKDRLATHFVPFTEFEKDAAAGTLPDFSWIEPNFIAGHGDYHPAMGRAMGPQLDLAVDPPSSILSGEAFLERVFNAYRSATSESGTNVWNTALLIGWDEPGGTYDHVAAGTGPAARPGRTGGRVRLHVRPFRLPGPRDHRLAVGRAGLGVQRGVPPHLAHRDVAKRWDLGEAFTQRDASARTFDHVFTRDTPRDPQDWATFEAQPVPEWTMDEEVVGNALSTLGKAAGPGLIERARELGVALPPQLDDPSVEAHGATHHRGPQGHLLALLPAARSFRRKRSSLRVAGARVSLAVAPTFGYDIATLARVRSPRLLHAATRSDEGLACRIKVIRRGPPTAQERTDHVRCIPG